MRKRCVTLGIVSRALPVESRCLCGANLNTVMPGTGARDVEPRSGDVTVCLACQRVWTFDANFKLAPIDIEALPLETRRAVRRLQGEMIIVRKRSN